MLNKLKELRKSGSEEGFTLIELMIVVVIIGILAAIAIPIFMNQQKGAIGASLKSDVKNTVTDLNTALVKNPTATDVSTLITPRVSDNATQLTVAGAWDNYTVRAVNDNSDPGCWEYSSVTGKSVECNDTGSGNGSGVGSGVNITRVATYNSMAGSGFIRGNRMYSTPAVEISVYDDGSIQGTSTGEFRYTLNDGSENVFENAYNGTITVGVWRAGSGINASDTLTLTINDGRIVSSSGSASQQTLDIISGSQQGNVYVQGYGDYTFASA